MGIILTILNIVVIVILSSMIGNSIQEKKYGLAGFNIGVLITNIIALLLLVF